MRLLYHFPLCPHSRLIRLALAEKNLDFNMCEERPWEWREDFLILNPAGEVPVLIDAQDHVIADYANIVEYLEETYPEKNLLGTHWYERNEARRLMHWFARKFHLEVTQNLIGEKLMKRLYKEGLPSTQIIRAGQNNIRNHLDYISFLIDRRNWLAGDEFSYADISAAAQISTIDYLGDVPWMQYPEARVWYARVKSRKSFRGILTDCLPTLAPAQHYTNLDF